STPIPLPQMMNGIGGPGALLLPQFLMGGTYASQIVIANVSNAPQNVRADIFTDAGAPLTTVLNGQSASTVTAIQVPPNSVVTLEPQDANGTTVFGGTWIADRKSTRLN